MSSAEAAETRLIYCTTESREEACRIGQLLVEEQRVACANILPGMTAIYRWQGQLETSSEAVLILKTTVDQVEALIPRIVELHRYECPAILVLPVETGHPAYLEWIRQAVP
ncbi:MAG: divalent-cation tolerance protein CutA [Planctomycetaceae bacterium]|nr:divalent-cation tolerance protein CutA [Planctomycetaceae bacterium]